MRFAFCNEGFGHTPWASVCRTLAGAGYAGVEIAPFTMADDVRLISAHRRAEIKRIARDAGLEIVGLHFLLVKPEGWHVAHPDKAVRRATCGYLCDLAEFCADLGAGVMVFGSPKQRGTNAGATPSQAWEWAKETIAELLPTLADCDVVLCMEPLAPTDPYGDKATDFLNTAADARRFMNELDHTNVRLILDVRSMCSENRPIPEIIRENADQLAHFHANDVNDGAPGFGDVDFRPILQELREIRYSGYVSLEPFRLELDAETVARRSLRYLEGCQNG